MKLVEKGRSLLKCLFTPLPFSRKLFTVPCMRERGFVYRKQQPTLGWDPPPVMSIHVCLAKAVGDISFSPSPTCQPFPFLALGSPTLLCSLSPPWSQEWSGHLPVRGLLRELSSEPGRAVICYPSIYILQPAFVGIPHFSWI